MGRWRRGSAFALHAKDPGFESLSLQEKASLGLILYFFWICYTSKQALECVILCNRAIRILETRKATHNKTFKT